MHALVDSLDEPSDPHLVAPPGLAEALIDEINLGVLDNARAGGPLAPLAAEANFSDLFALGHEQRAALATILARLDAIEHELRGRGAPITINNFTGGWRPLRAGYLDPADARAAILRAPFTGRAWLVQEVDAFIRDHDRGYFIIQGDAGTGKTAFALWYSGLDQRPIHFTAYGRDARKTAAAVRNLAAQLIMLCGLDDLAPGGRLPAEADWDWYSWLRQLLAAAAEQRAAADSGRPIVLVVDGLDEAAEPDVDDLPFGLPDDLPTRVYVVATVRTGGLPHLPNQPVVVCDWNRREAQQQADLRAFITEFVQLRLATALREDGVTPAAFVTALLDRCGDVWLYLHYVLEEIASGYRRPREVPLLPAGLENYYHNTIERFCEQDTDASWRLPLLATLAIAVEPLDVETLINLAGLDDHPHLRRFLDGPLRPFCTVSPAGHTDAADPPQRIRLKHPSFGEYLAAGPDIGDSTADRVDNVHQRRIGLAAECRAAGQRVCDRYLTMFGGEGGLDAGLPALAAEPSLAQRDGGYPLRGLATHLLATGRDDDLHKLLACGSQDRNVWYAAHEASGDTRGFLDDVALARRALDRPADGQPDPRWEAKVVSLKTRYALVEASVATAFTNTSPDLLVVLVKRGHWSSARALGTIARMTDEHQQAQALLGIVDSTPNPLVPNGLVPDAWAIALALRDRKRRCRALPALIPRLPDDLLDAAVEAVAELARESGALAAAAALVDRLPEGRLNHFPWSAMPTMAYDQAMVVTRLVALKYGLSWAVDGALEYLVEEVDNEFERCQYLAVLIPRLPATAFDRVMAVLAGCRARYRSDALLALARHAPVNRLTNLLDLASDVAWENTPPEAEPQPWLRMMREFGPRLAGPDQEAGALAVAQALLVERGAEAIEVLAPQLSVESARDALHDIEARSVHWGNFRDTRWLMIAVAALARRLPPAEAGALIERYVKKYCSVDQDLHVVPPPREEEPSIFEAEHLAPAASFLPRDTVRLTLRSICRGISVGGSFAADLTPALARMAPKVGTDPALVREAFAMMLNPSAWQPASRLTVLSVLAPHLDDDSLDEAMGRVLPGPVEVECFAAIAALGRELPEDRRATVARRALDAALDIGHDRQRTLAVAALAPTMPADVAERALQFVGSVTRLVHPPHVFSALDSLAPHLPVTALPRALEIFMNTPMVDSGDIQHVTRLFERLGRHEPTGVIRNHFQGPQRSRSWPWESWLWALAPFLPAALAEEALAVAKTLPADRDRRVALAALAPRLPDRLQTAATHEALELLDVAPDNVSIRIAVLARLAAATATAEVTAACQQLLTGLRPADLHHSDHSWDAFRDLLTHLPSDLVEDVLRFSTRLFLDERCQLIRTLAPQLPHRLLPDLVAALEAAAAVSDAELGEHGRALVALAARTPDEDERHRILTAVLQRMVKRRWWHATGPTFVDLIPLSPPPLRSQAVVAAVQQCFDEHRPDDLGPLLDVLEEAELQLVFEQLGRIGDPHLRAATTAAVLRRAGALADRSMGFLDVDVFRAWPPAGTRAELFTLVGASAWWIRRHGGDRAVAAAIDAVFDVSRWWR